MTPEFSITVFGGATTFVVAVMGWLINRSVRALDTSISELKFGMAGLVAVDTKIQIELAELRTRLVHVEYLVMGASRRPTGEHPKAGG